MSFLQNEHNESADFKESNWQYLLPMEKTQGSVKGKCVYHCVFDSFSVLKAFVSVIVDDINKYDFWYCVMKCINICKICVTVIQ